MRVGVTRLGSIGSFYYVRHQTMRLYDDRLAPAMGLMDLIRLLSESTEYEEIPMRHNDDNYCRELAKSVPVKAKLNYEDPKSKTFLLFQAHLFHVAPPISDFHTDCKIAV